eukprot:ANDGO_07574.mRNA.1 hypothetical protein
MSQLQLLPFQTWKHKSFLAEFELFRKLYARNWNSYRQLGFFQSCNAVRRHVAVLLSGEPIRLFEEIIRSDRSATSTKKPDACVVFEILCNVERQLATALEKITRCGTYVAATLSQSLFMSFCASIFAVLARMHHYLFAAQSVISKSILSSPLCTLSIRSRLLSGLQCGGMMQRNEDIGVVGEDSLLGVPMADPSTFLVSNAAVDSVVGAKEAVLPLSDSAARLLGKVNNGGLQVLGDTKNPFEVTSDSDSSEWDEIVKPVFGARVTRDTATASSSPPPSSSSSNLRLLNDPLLSSCVEPSECSKGKAPKEDTSSGPVKFRLRDVLQSKHKNSRKRQRDDCRVSNEAQPSKVAKTISPTMKPSVLTTTAGSCATSSSSKRATTNSAQQKNTDEKSSIHDIASFLFS